MPAVSGAPPTRSRARGGLRAELPARDERRRPFPFSTLAVVVGMLDLALFAWAWLIDGKAVGVALVVVPLLVLLSTPIFVRASREHDGFDIGGLLALSLLLRFAASYYRFLHAADGGVYHNFGSQLAVGYRHFEFGADPGAPVPGSGGMRIVTGVVEVFTNGNMYATFLVFAWLSFLGCYLFYKAFRLALPDCDVRRYAILVMLWPTLLYWPSSIGKDCWLILGLGIASLGAAKIFVRRPGGYTLLLVGTVLGSFVRPHVSMLLAIAFAVGLLIGRRADRPGTFTPAAVAKIAGLVVVLALGAYLATRTAALLNAQDINGTVDAALSQNAARTAQGGSFFQAANPENPLGYLQAAVTVLLRPFPFEAHGIESLATSLEGLGLFVLIVASWKRLRSIPRRVRPEPYVAVAISFILMFFFAFGTIGNFGLLARERSMMMPYVFVLLSLTALAPRARKVRGARAGAGGSGAKRSPVQPRIPTRPPR